MTQILRETLVDEVPGVVTGTALNNALMQDFQDRIDLALAALDAAIAARGTGWPVNLATDVVGTLAATNAPAYTGGDVTSLAGSGVLTIGAGKVTSAMLGAAAIAASKLVQTDIVLAESQITSLVADLAAILTSVNAKALKTIVIANTDTGTLNNWAPTGMVGNTLMMWAGAADATVTGLASGVAGQIFTFRNVGVKVAYFAHVGGGSIAAAQFTNCAASAPTPVAPGGALSYCHDGTNWRLVAHEQGAWISPAYSAGDYTSSAGTWVVQAGDVGGCSFYLSGRKLSVKLSVFSSTVTGSPASLVRALPGGFAAPTTYNQEGSSFLAYLGSGSVQVARAYAYGTTLSFYTSPVPASWPTTTDLTQIFGSAEIEVT